MAPSTMNVRLRASRSSSGSFHFLQSAIRTIPMGMAYAIWTGVGAVGTVIIEALFFGERSDATRLALLGVIVAAIIGLKLVEA